MDLLILRRQQMIWNWELWNKIRFLDSQKNTSICWRDEMQLLTKSTQFPRPLGMVILRNVTLIELHPIKCCRNNNDDEARPLETTTRDCSQVS